MLEKVLAEHCNNLQCPDCGKPVQGIKIMGSSVASLCQECENKFQAAQMLEEQKKEILNQNRMLRNSGYLKRHILQEFENYEINNPNQQVVFDICRQFADNLSKKWLFLLGAKGTGKDHLASSIGKVFLKNKKSVLAGTAQHLLRIFRTKAYSSNGNELEAMRFFEDVDLLIIRDAGVKSATDNEWAVMTDILDRRYDDMKPIIVTANIEPQNFTKQLFDERILDRLFEVGVYKNSQPYVDCQWSSFRKSTQEMN